MSGYCQTVSYLLPTCVGFTANKHQINSQPAFDPTSVNLLPTSVGFTANQHQTYSQPASELLSASIGFTGNQHKIYSKLGFDLLPICAAFTAKILEDLLPAKGPIPKFKEKQPQNFLDFFILFDI
jgi:hypothetical protein